MIKHDLPSSVLAALNDSDPLLCLKCDRETFERRAVALSQLMPFMPTIQIVETPIEHRFTDGVYTRIFEAPAGAIVVGHLHKTRHENVILSGSATVVINGEQVFVSAGDVLISDAGARKVLHVHEKIRWMTIHPNHREERDTEKLEADLVDKQSALTQYPEELNLIETIFHIERRIA